MQRIEETTAVILAGGLGTRLRSVIADRQKVVAEVNGRPFLLFLLSQIEKAGISRAVLCVGYHADEVEKTLGSTYRRLQLTYSREESPLGTGGAVRNARSLCSSETVLVLNGDSYCDVDLVDVYSAHSRKAADLTMVLAYVDDTSRYGRVRLDDHDCVAGFYEKNQTSGPGWINAGIYLFTDSVLDSIPQQVSVSLERDVFPKWAERNCFGYRSTGVFIDIGTPQSYQLSQNVLAHL